MKLKIWGQKKNNNKRRLKIGIKILIKFLRRKIQNFLYIKLKSNTFIRIHLMIQSKRIFFYIKIYIFLLFTLSPLPKKIECYYFSQNNSFKPSIKLTFIIHRFYWKFLKIVTDYAYFQLYD